MKVADVQSQIEAASDAALADGLIQAYEELRARFLRGDFRPSSLAGGRFAEAAFRILQYTTTGNYTPLDRSLPGIPSLLRTIESADQNAHDSIRVHIPRALAAVYNVRNRRDVGHLAAEVDANVMDAQLVLATCSWVLAEFVRLFHQCSPEEAKAFVDGISKRRPPMVQLFGDEPLVLRTDLKVRDEILLLLYRQDSGASLDDLDSWTPTSIPRSQISARLSDLVRRDRFVHKVGNAFLITDTGAEHVELSVMAPA